MAPPMRTCLGTRLAVPLGNTTTATLLVEYVAATTTDQQGCLEIKLSTATCHSYHCTLSISDVATINIFGETVTTDSEKLLALGKLLLRENNNDEKDDLLQTQNLTTSFQYDDNKNNPNIILLVHEQLSNGMKRRLLERKLEVLGNGLEYAVAVGGALNQALHEIGELRKARDHWKSTAIDLQTMQQTQKDTLLANFTTLRNKLFQQHQMEIQELQAAAAHGNENASAKKKAKPKAAREPSPEHGDLLANDQVVALAQGRKLDASPVSKRPKRLHDAVDMVQIRNQGLEYQRTKPQKRKHDKEEDSTLAKKGKPSDKHIIRNQPTQNMPPPTNDNDSTASESSWTLK